MHSYNDYSNCHFYSNIHQPCLYIFTPEKGMIYKRNILGGHISFNMEMYWNNKKKNVLYLGWLKCSGRAINQRLQV